MGPSEHRGPDGGPQERLAGLAATASYSALYARGVEDVAGSYKKNARAARRWPGYPCAKPIVWFRMRCRPCPPPIRPYKCFANLLAPPPLPCFIVGQREVLGNIGAPAPGPPFGCRRSDVFAVGSGVRPSGFPRTSSSPAQGCPGPRSQLLSHPIPARLLAVRLCGRCRAVDSRGFGGPGWLWRCSVSSFSRLPAASQPRSPCRLIVSFRAARAMYSARTWRALP